MNQSARVDLKGTTEIEIARDLRAPIEMVWRAFHEPELVAQWWGLPAHENHITEIDLQPGGRWRFGQRAADGSEVIYGGRYVEIDEPRQFAYTKEWAKTAAADAPTEVEESVITATFEPIDVGTRVVLVCQFDTEEMRNVVASSGMDRMQASYDRMDDLLASLLR